jgi:tagatose-6-phosphate ketose/aldose isomerase
MTTHFTLKEIQQQVSLWKETLVLVENHRQAIHDFLKPLKAKGTLKIIFVGAGSSEYVGNALVPALNPFYEYGLRSVASTEIVDDPYHLIPNDSPVLAVSFGRSGNSPESIHAITALNHVSNQVYHLAITCNPDGALAKIRHTIDRAYAFVLPEETHDQGFAMTSSFTSMSLAAYALFHPQLTDTITQEWFQHLEANWRIWMSQAKDCVESFNFDRYVVLGGHEAKGFAQESALKMLELSSGSVATQYDSPMGFRHGPKSFLTSTTLVLVFKRNASSSMRYEEDVIQEIKNSQRKSRIKVLSFSFEDEYLSALARMIFTQSLAYYKSLSLGIEPDTPSQDNEVNRVVAGVILYPYQ